MISDLGYCTAIFGDSQLGDTCVGGFSRSCKDRENSCLFLQWRYGCKSDVSLAENCTLHVLWFSLAQSGTPPNPLGVRKWSIEKAKRPSTGVFFFHSSTPRNRINYWDFSLFWYEHTTLFDIIHPDSYLATQLTCSLSVMIIL